MLSPGSFPSDVFCTFILFQAGIDCIGNLINDKRNLFLAKQPYFWHKFFHIRMQVRHRSQRGRYRVRNKSSKGGIIHFLSLLADTIIHLNQCIMFQFVSCINDGQDHRLE